jgi:hypothetical protein
MRAGTEVRTIGAPAPGTRPPLCAKRCARLSWYAAGTAGLRVATTERDITLAGGR